jgi:hypothetical protein
VSTDIPVSLRRLVVKRANNLCEYCLISEAVTLYKHEPDHIIPRQHGGETIESNLALACMRCNRYKGTNIGSFDLITGKLVPLFNPRINKWSDHFNLAGSIIQPLTGEARVTIKLLKLNEENRVAERYRFIEAGLYN